MKREEEERMERLLSETTFERLAVEEREWVIRMLGSEEKFSALQKVEHALSGPELRSNLEPEKRVLDSLKRTMQSKSQNEPAWYSFLSMKVPAYVTALLVIFSSGVAGWITKNSQTPKIIAGETIIKSDTVYVSKIDTVFRERVIYRQASTAPLSINEMQTARALEKAAPVSTGVSMKDKEELNKLLVSGSD